MASRTRSIRVKRLTRTSTILPPEELAGIPTVCGSLREALNSLGADNSFLTAGGVFTESQIEGYMELKWEEVYNFEHTPHPVEYQMYYSC